MSSFIFNDPEIIAVYSSSDQNQERHLDGEHRRAPFLGVYGKARQMANEERIRLGNESDERECFPHISSERYQ